ncbi:uncharacterized protein LY89DRAFT_741776 [Mollisia scopiformis]|uniref:Uncharacterized protein n=1 Tax=Mollisia scopiformis TaxID=149040 RepID=A0A132B7M4_MOLSC|nr:uncharacterized protein LY89DRAFT_741776 [Mollisia scopiformis]KUJ08406.1 hypothetical protein LY89DRAFT_741776 [Mollisia scopiformis]
MQTKQLKLDWADDVIEAVASGELLDIKTTNIVEREPIKKATRRCQLNTILQKQVTIDPKLGSRWTSRGGFEQVGRPEYDSELENGLKETESEQSWLESVMPQDNRTPGDKVQQEANDDALRLGLQNIERLRESLEVRSPAVVQESRLRSHFPQRVFGHVEKGSSSKLKGRRAVEYNDLWVETASNKSKRSLWDLGITIDEILITVGEINLLDDKRLGKHRCRPSLLRISWTWSL